MAKHFFGTDEIVQSWDSYFEVCNAIELDLQSFKATPKIETLNRWRVESPRGFCFMLETSPGVSAYFDDADEIPESPDAYPDAFTAAWEETLERANALAAKTLLLKTNSEVTPGDHHRDRLRAFAEHFADEAKPEILWEPAGLWTPEQTTEFARDIGFIPVFDPFVAHRDEYEFTHGDVGFVLSERPGMRREFDLFDLKELIGWTAKYDRVFTMFRGRQKWNHVKQFKVAVEQDKVRR